MDFGRELENLLKSNAAEFGKELRQDFTEVRQYTVSQVAKLAMIVGQPGYELAIKAVRDNVALRLGIAITTKADAADQRLIGVISGVIEMGARMLGGVV